MNNSRPIVNISLLLGTIIAVSAFFLVFNNIPVQALHKEQQLLESFDDLADFAKAVKNGDEELEEIPIQSMKDADIYDDADDNLKDCIDLAAEIGDSLTDKEVVHCVDDVNYFKNKYSNSTVPTNATSATTGVADTGSDTTSTSDTADTTSTSNAADTTSTSNAADTTSTSNAADTTSTSNAADTTSTSNAADTTSTSNAADTTSTSDAADTTSTSDAADTTSTSGNANDNNLVDELVKTGKFTEAEAREFVTSNMQSGTGTDTTSDIKTSNADTNTADTTSSSNADTNAADTTSSSNADTNAADTTSSSNADTNAADTTSTSNADTNAADTKQVLMQIPTLLIPRLLMQIPTLLIPRLLMQIPTLMLVLRPMILPQLTTKTTMINLQIITAIILMTMTTLTS